MVVDGRGRGSRGADRSWAGGRGRRGSGLKADGRKMVRRAFQAELWKRGRRDRGEGRRVVDPPPTGRVSWPTEGCSSPRVVPLLSAVTAGYVVVSGAGGTALLRVGVRRPGGDPRPGCWRRDWPGTNPGMFARDGRRGMPDGDSHLAVGVCRRDTQVPRRLDRARSGRQGGAGQSRTGRRGMDAETHQVCVYFDTGSPPRATNMQHLVERTRGSVGNRRPTWIVPPGVHREHRGRLRRR